MKDTSPTNGGSNDRIVLGLLTSVDSNGARSQRHIAVELDIALGLVNAYVKRSIKKGLVKVSQAPARRYAYYLTPQGFSEKSRGRARRRPWSLQRLSQARNQKRTCKARASASPEVCLLSHSSG